VKKTNSRLTFSQIVNLYSKYIEYTKGLKEHGLKHSQRTTLSDIAEDTGLKKSTIHHYFNKIFAGKPAYLSNLFTIYKKNLFRTFRNRKPSSALICQEKKVVDWILRARQAGLPVGYSDVREKGLELIVCKPGLRFSNKWVKNFLKRHNLSLRKATHRTIRNNMTVIKSKIEIYLKNIKTLRGKWKYDDSMIINFDETPIFFDFEVKTVEKKGKKFVRALQIAKDKRLTCGITIAASGDVLPSLLIYNQPGVLKCENNDYDHDMRFFHTKSGWVNEEVFIYWLEEIILPYVKKRRALLVFDTYSAHVSKAFQDQILKYDNLDIALIPGGLTYLLQPLDVSFNHSFKTLIHNEWKKYLNSQKEEIIKAHESLKEKKNEEVPGNQTEIKKEDLKNSKMRKLLKKGFFNQARRKIKDGSCTLKLIQVDTVVDWVNSAIEKMRRKRKLIIKSFKICGLSNNLDGSEDRLIHNYEYLMNRL